MSPRTTPPARGLGSRNQLAREQGPERNRHTGTSVFDARVLPSPGASAPRFPFHHPAVPRRKTLARVRSESRVDQQEGEDVDAEVDRAAGHGITAARAMLSAVELACQIHEDSHRSQIKRTIRRHSSQSQVALFDPPSSLFESAFIPPSTDSTRSARCHEECHNVEPCRQTTLIRPMKSALLT